MIKLYDYYRSTACYRVRIALNLKKIKYKKIEVHLINNGGEQYQVDYLKINPQALVPSLQLENGEILSQSIAIIDYLESAYPTPALLPKEPLIAAQIKRISQIIACDMHPLNNLRVLQYLQKEFNINNTQKINWYHHWLKKGFDAIEQLLKKLPRSENVVYGDEPGYGDLFLIPQVYNAHRFEFDMDEYPIITHINQYCLGLNAFRF